MKNRFGVIDIGSNSVRMVIYDVSSKPPAQIYNEKVFSALGRDLSRTGKLNPEGVEAALEGLRQYARVAEESRLGGLDVVGTAALRDSSDGAAFINRVKEETGLAIRLISGDQEARYAALGVLSLDPEAVGVVADFGGGSLELARIAAGGIYETVSRPYGAFRALAMEGRIDAEIGSGLAQLAPVFGNAPALYTIGGSWRALAQAYMMESGEERHLQGYTIPAVEMGAFCRTIAQLDPDAIRARYKMEDKRAVLAPVSASVLALVLAGLAPRYMTVSMAGIRDGIVYDFNNG